MVIPEAEEYLYAHGRIMRVFIILTECKWSTSCVFEGQKCGLFCEEGFACLF